MNQDKYLHKYVSIRRSNLPVIFDDNKDSLLKKNLTLLVLESLFRNHDFCYYVHKKVDDSNYAIHIRNAEVIINKVDIRNIIFFDDSSLPQIGDVLKRESYDPYTYYKVVGKYKYQYEYKDDFYLWHTEYICKRLYGDDLYIIPDYKSILTSDDFDMLEVIKYFQNQSKSGF